MASSAVVGSSAKRIFGLQAKASAISAPRPEYPYEARSRKITGSGVCVVTVDTGSPTQAANSEGIVGSAQAMPSSAPTGAR